MIDEGNEQKLFNEVGENPYDTKMELPDYQKTDKELKEQLAAKYEAIKQKAINKDQNYIQERSDKIVMAFIQKFLAPIGYLLALVAAFLIVFIFPGSGLENTIVPLIASVFGYLGLADWRAKLGAFETWFKSKTLVGALLVALPIIGVVVCAIFVIPVPGIIMTILTTLITIGGGTSIYGIFDANQKVQ